MGNDITRREFFKKAGRFAGGAIGTFALPTFNFTQQESSNIFMPDKEKLEFNLFGVSSAEAGKYIKKDIPYLDKLIDAEIARGHGGVAEALLNQIMGNKKLARRYLIGKGKIPRGVGYVKSSADFESPMQYVVMKKLRDFPYPVDKFLNERVLEQNPRLAFYIKAFGCFGDKNFTDASVYALGGILQAAYPTEDSQKIFNVAKNIKNNEGVKLKLESLKTSDRFNNLKPLGQFATDMAYLTGVMIFSEMLSDKKKVRNEGASGFMDGKSLYNKIAKQVGYDTYCTGLVPNGINWGKYW